MTSLQNTIFLPGELTSGKEVRRQNVSATTSLASIIRTTLGPNGLDKMLVDQVGETTVTNDGATILQKLDVAHPAAKVLVELSHLQDREVGDGTTSVVIVAAELLREANELIGRNMHSTTVMSGYQLALRKVLNYIEKRLTVDVANLTDEDLVNVAKTSMSSKIIGQTSDHFSRLVVEAIKSVRVVVGDNENMDDDEENEGGDDKKDKNSENEEDPEKKDSEEASTKEKKETTMDDAISQKLKANAITRENYNVLDNELRARGGRVRYPVRSVGVLKALGGSARDSQLVQGFALNSTRASLEMPDRITNARIALLDFNLQQQRLAVGVQTVIKDASKLEGVRQLENDICKRRIKLLIDAGANVILTTGAMDDMAQKYLTENNVLGCRRVTLEDMRRIAKVTKGQILSTLADLDGVESADPSTFGHAEEVTEERIADDCLIFIRGGIGRKCGSIILRGPNTQMLDEIGRSVHDSLCAVSRTLESGRVVPGGGCVEAALSVYLEEYSKTVLGKEQLAVAAFARALLSIPRQLATNSALDAVELVARLRAAHARAQRKETPVEEKENLRASGLDLRRGIVTNNVKNGVLEPMMSKIKSLSFATEAAITILRIDDSIVLNPEKKEQQ